MPYFHEATIAFLDENPWMHPDDPWYGRTAIGQSFSRWDEEEEEEEEIGAYFYDSDSEGEDEYVYEKHGKCLVEKYPKEKKAFSNKHFYEIEPDDWVD